MRRDFAEEFLRILELDDPTVFQVSGPVHAKVPFCKYESLFTKSGE